MKRVYVVLAVVGAVMVLAALIGSFVPSAVAQVRIGPPPGKNVVCTQTTLNDEIRGRKWTLTRCFRTAPVFPRAE